MIVLALFLTLILGMIIDRSLQALVHEDCPRRVLGYNCQGLTCDHRKSELYLNMSHMALNDEEM